MTVNSYLTNLASTAIIRDQERENIRKSLATMRIRLNNYFGKDIKNQIIFGSYSRGTILPRSMDARSDIDYMVVFENGDFQPQTYLNRLRRFVSANYATSEISQSNPTIVLSLNHIKFDLVPAIDTWFNGLQIPAKATDYQDWLSTNPNNFNDNLVRANTSNSNYIKPLVRLLKYWNAKNRYPFDSYDLEQKIVEYGFGIWGIVNTIQLRDYFYEYIENMNAGWFVAQWKEDAVKRAKEIVRKTKRAESQGYPIQAETELKRLLPPLGLRSGLLG